MYGKNTVILVIYNNNFVDFILKLNNVKDKHKG